MAGRRAGAHRSWPTSPLCGSTTVGQYYNHGGPLMRSAASHLGPKIRAGESWSRWIAGTPFSLAYAGFLVARSHWWARFGQTSPLPTISVGNLTTGGNGKTPFALFLASRLSQSGLRVALVSRGYGGKNFRGARLVSDGRHI